jgi:hypothetical protein
MTLFERSVLMPDIKGVEVSGSREVKEIIVAGMLIRKSCPSSCRVSYSSSKMKEDDGRPSTRPQRSD